jgi:hypothetical protein
MPDDIKFTVTERNGTELTFHEEEEFIPSKMPFDDVAYTADNVKDAILETSTAGGQSRYALICGYEANTNNGRWLEFHRGNPSNTSPYVVAESSQLISLSVSNADTVTSSTFAVYKNGISAATIIITSGSTASTVLGSPIDLVADDELSVQKTAGDSCSEVTLSLNIKVTF